MDVHIGSDHRGFELKQEVAAYLREQDHTVTDHGTHSAERADYPRFGRAVAEAVAAAGPGTLGIVICGSGVGISIAANKVRGVRSIPAWCEHIAEFGRRHNHANVLAFSADLQTFTQTRRCLEAYFAAETEGGRHAERVSQLEC